MLCTEVFLFSTNSKHFKLRILLDIKGANILLETGGVCKLADFGSSKQLSELNEYNTLIGTANWMPPEVIKQTKGGRLKFYKIFFSSQIK